MNQQTVIDLKIAIVKRAAIIGTVPAHQRDPAAVREVNKLCRELLDMTGEAYVAGMWVTVVQH